MKQSLRKIKALVACAAVGLAVAGGKPVQADLITYTDRATFETAVGNFKTETFNSITSDTPFTNSNLAFPDLTLRSSGGAYEDTQILVDVPGYEYSLYGGNGSALVNMGGYRILSRQSASILVTLCGL